MSSATTRTVRSTGRATGLIVGLLLVTGFLAVGAAISAIGARAGGIIPSKGQIPERAFLVNGTIDPAQVPDFVSVLTRDGAVAGYVPKDYAIGTGFTPFAPGTPDNPPVARSVPVLGEDLATVVGHMVPGKGFVPVGIDPATVPDIPAEVSAE